MCGKLSVWARNKWHCSCVNFAPLQYIEQARLCALCAMFICVSVYAGQCKCAFCFAQDLMSFLDCFAPWGESWCAAIWFLHPPTLPHNPPLPWRKQKFLQPVLSVYPSPFPSGSWSVWCPSITMPEWIFRDALFHPHRHRDLSDEMGDSYSAHMPFLQLLLSFSLLPWRRKLVYFNLWLADTACCDLIW